MNGLVRTHGLIQTSQDDTDIENQIIHFVNGVRYTVQFLNCDVTDPTAAETLNAKSIVRWKLMYVLTNLLYFSCIMYYLVCCILSCQIIYI